MSVTAPGYQGHRPAGSQDSLCSRAASRIRTLSDDVATIPAARKSRRTRATTSRTGPHRIVAAVLPGTSGGPNVTPTISFPQVIGYNLLIVAAILVLRVLLTIFRNRENAGAGPHPG
jgi:hypothetical protein